MSRNESDTHSKQLLSRSEGRKLFVMAVVLITMVVYLFRTGFKTADPNDTSGIPITLPGMSEPYELPSQDPAKARDALLRSEAAKAEAAKTQGVAPEQAPAFQFDPKILQTVKEGGPEALNVVEEPAFYHLCALVHGMSDEGLRAAPKTLGTWKWTGLRSPEGRVAARGKFATLQGRFLIPLTQRVLETYPNEAGLVWVWQGILRVQNRGYFVTITDKNFEPEIGLAGTIIEVDAAFLKGHAYESQRGTVQLPHVVVKSFRKVKPVAEWDYMNSEIVWGAVIAFFVTTLLMVLYALRSRRSAAEFDSWRQKRLASKKAGKPKDSSKGAEPSPLDPSVEPAPSPAAEPPASSPAIGSAVSEAGAPTDLSAAAPPRAEAVPPTEAAAPEDAEAGPPTETTEAPAEAASAEAPTDAASESESQAPGEAAATQAPAEAAPPGEPPQTPSGPTSNLGS